MRSGCSPCRGLRAGLGGGREKEMVGEIWFFLACLHAWYCVVGAKLVTIVVVVVVVPSR